MRTGGGVVRSTGPPLLAGVAVARLGLGGRALAGPVALDHPEREIASCLAAEPSATLGTGHRLVELWAADPEPAEPGDLVLFAPDRLCGQRADHRLFAGSTGIERGFLLESIRSFDGGWTLWRVEGERPGHGLERVSP